MRWRFWKRKKFIQMERVDISPEEQKEIDKVEEIIRDCGGEIKGRKIEVDEDEIEVDEDEMS